MRVFCFACAMCTHTQYEMNRLQLNSFIDDIAFWHRYSNFHNVRNKIKSYRIVIIKCYLCGCALFCFWIVGQIASVRKQYKTENNKNLKQQIIMFVSLDFFFMFQRLSNHNHHEFVFAFVCNFIERYCS